MNIIEQHIQGKRSQDTCEDGIVVTDHFVAVIDGGTAKSPRTLRPDMSNGRWCMTLIKEYIDQMPANISLEGFCQEMTRRIHNQYPEDDSRLKAYPHERLCASAVIYSRAKQEIWMIGDCQCLVDGVHYHNDKPYEAALTRKRAEQFQQMCALHPDMLSDKGELVHDYARDTIIEDLLVHLQGENIEYAVLDGFPVAMQGVKVIPVDHPATIVLASDGYPFLKPTLDESEDELARQLRDDPYMLSSFPATKGLMAGNVSFDDRAYIRFDTSPHQRYFVWMSFDGTAYHGWQIQPNGMSVQEKVQQCLSLILRRDVEVTGAGRTDAGVHARQMVCHFDWPETLDAPQLEYKLNRVLPRDISCEKIEPVGHDLHARFSATKRTYRYFVHTRRDPFLRHYSMLTHWELDFALMNEAAAWLLQVEDFKAFCKTGGDNKTTLCEVTTARWVQTSPTAWYFEIAANRFLRNMVRAVVGTLIEVGRHRMTVDAFKQVVTKGTRSDAGESMPAHALFLWSIAYEGTSVAD
jgi:tRNA pseudouridine38-40 synthase